MPFQFYCPRGHLLQGDESQAGQTCRCPYCDSRCLIPPAPQVASVPAYNPPPTYQPPEEPSPPSETSPFDPAFTQQSDEFHLPAFEPSPEPEPEQSSAWAEEFPQVGGGSNSHGGSESAETLPAEALLVDSLAQAVVHIPCPNGHQLETPREILGEDAMCPICQAQFHLRLEDSIEYRRHRAEQFEQRERQIGNQWMNAAIIAAVVVLGAVLFLLAAVVSR